MTRLPPELYRPIIQYINHRKDLASLALTSRAFQAEAEQRLYRELHFSEWSNGDGRNISQSAQFKIFKLLGRSPRHAAYVHTLSFESHRARSSATCILTALQATVNLKRLILHIPTGPSLLHKIPAPTFNLESMVIVTRQFLRIQDGQFLEKQTELKELEVHYSEPGVRDCLPVFAAPKLRILSLRGIAGARGILLQQTVMNVSLEHFYDCRDEDVYASVRSLKISAESFQLRNATQFPNLRYFWTANLPDIHAIPLLKSLRKISLCLNGSSNINWRDYRPIAVTLFALGDSVEQVQVRWDLYAYEFSREMNQDECLPKLYDDEEWRVW